MAGKLDLSNLNQSSISLLALLMLLLAVGLTQQDDSLSTAEPSEIQEPEAVDEAPEVGHSGPEWSYTRQDDWQTHFPKCRSISRQSPINIVTSEVVERLDYELSFIDYDQELEFTLKNSHHTINAIPITQTKPMVRLNWLEDDCEFELVDIHFHWGDGIHKGSEHEVNGQRAAAEMHMVHYRKGLTADQVGSVENSVVVIGVFIESDSVEHAKLESLVEDCSHINGTDSSEFKTDNTKHLINLLPNQHTFYTYNGSLTTPPCHEVVTWIVMSQPVFMANQRLIELSNIETFKPRVGRTKIMANYREVQPMMDRKVFSSFHTEELVSPEVARNKTRNRFSRGFDKFMLNVKKVRKFISKERSKFKHEENDTAQ